MQLDDVGVVEEAEELHLINEVMVVVFPVLTAFLCGLKEGGEGRERRGIC